MTQLLNSFLTSDSLDFAIRHISNFYDTDFFPRTEEFLALSHSWAEVKTHLLSSNLDQIHSASPIAIPWPKVRSSYRIVHRLEPLDAIVYTALAKVISDQIEASRAPTDVACSYRLSSHPTSFFGNGTGFETFRTRCEEHSFMHSHVLCADITDFYNKIYLHRLQNAIQLAVQQPPHIANRIEYFLTSLNTKASQGVPVGPAASIVMAEATLNDVDQFLFGKGVVHVRYVDDFRIFGTFEQLQQLVQSLTLYLHESQRLTLNSEKTYIVTTEEFRTNDINNQYQQEKLQIFGAIEGVNPYAMPEGNDDEENEEAAIEYEVGNAGEVLTEAIGKLLQYPTLDLGLTRAIVRSAKAHKTSDLVPVLLQKLDFFSPAINDVILYLDAVSSDEFLIAHSEVLEAVCDSPAMNIVAARMWVCWYFARHRTLLMMPKVRDFIANSGDLRSQAQAAITMQNQSWVKERKTTLLHHALWSRRSVILAATVLSKDEREKWLQPLLGNNSLSLVDKWMAKWVIAGSPHTVAVPVPQDVPW